ncbi:TauD/TfdA dioxygenase family protein [Spongiimicrobium salis]|uniref:TauD/TfdA dioxygenase family protein n=1 Tax=Spongiimicrobium salis TaxID=1667022 RepID=UPI00374CAF6D
MDLFRKLLGKKPADEKLIFEKVNPYMGIEITNLDDITKITPNQFLEIKEMISWAQLIVLRGKRKWTEQEQTNFTQNLGTLELPITYSVPSSQIFEEKEKRTFVKESGHMWHSDRSYHQNPSHLSIFQMVEIPKNGTTTSFISLIESYNDLSETAKVEWNRYYTEYANSVIHPILWQHPFNGKNTIYFDFGFVSIMTDTCQTNSLPLKKANAILNQLNTIFSNQPSIYEHQWNTGDILIVDNYAAAHKSDIALNNPSDTRVLLRTTTKGIYF